MAIVNGVETDNIVKMVEGGKSTLATFSSRLVIE